MSSFIRQRRHATAAPPRESIFRLMVIFSDMCNCASVFIDVKFKKQEMKKKSRPESTLVEFIKCGKIGNVVHLCVHFSVLLVFIYNTPVTAVCENLFFSTWAMIA